MGVTNQYPTSAKQFVVLLFFSGGGGGEEGGGTERAEEGGWMGVTNQYPTSSQRFVAVFPPLDSQVLSPSAELKRRQLLHLT